MVLNCQYIKTMIGYNFRQNSVNYNNKETNGEISYERIIFNRYGIAERRKAMQLTQEKLAEKMGVSLQSISSIELGKKGIRPENLANLCLHLETTADYILYGKRSSTQMTDIVKKLSNLPADEYAIVKSLIELLSKN